MRPDASHAKRPIFAALSHLMTEDGDCLRWTAGVNGGGYPVWRIDGRTNMVSRAFWEEANGPIRAGRVIRFTCGMRRCVNIGHCAPATRKAVALECGANGLMGGQVRRSRIAAAKRAHPSAKLTAEIVAAIRASDETGSVLARRYGVCQKTICGVKRGILWRDYSSPFWMAA